MIHIYTDGSCWPNPSASGGWGFVAYQGADEIHTECGPSEGHTTSSRMELTAALRALQWLHTRPARIHCDSLYVVNGLNKWAKGWERANWQRREKGGAVVAVPNADLWRATLAVRYACHEFVWVRGHAGTLGNERADRLAEAGRQLCAI